MTRTVTMPDGTVLHDGPEVFESYYPMISKLTEVVPPPRRRRRPRRPTTTTTDFGLPPDITAPADRVLRASTGAAPR